MSIFVDLISSVYDPIDGCDRNNHPQFRYRPYRRGRLRCSVCGARIKPRIAILDNIYDSSPIVRALQDNPLKTGER